MSTETLKRTTVLADDWSAPAGAGARKEAANTVVGKVGDPEVAQVAKRRKHSAEYKLRILEEVDNNPGKIGIILRHEGLYSSNLTRWRRWKKQMKANKQSSTTKNKKLHNELARAQRENKRLNLKLKKAEGLIELQKKTSEMLNLMSINRNEEI